MAKQGCHGQERHHSICCCLSPVSGYSCGTSICKIHLIVAILAFRQAHLFAKDCGEDTRVVTDQLVSNISDFWIKYKIARHAMVTGKSSAAKGLFQSILSSTSSGASYLWLSALAKVAGAEEELSSKGSRGILSATPLLHSGLSYLVSLAAMSGNTTSASHNFGFQIRVRFFGLVCIAAQSLP